MANHELVLGQSQGLSLVPINHIAFEHSHIGRSYNTDSEQVQILDTKLAQDNQNVTLSQRRDHDTIYELSHVQNLEENDVKLDRDVEPAADQDHVTCSDSYDDKLALQEFNFADDRELAIIEHRDHLHEKLEFALDQNMELENLDVGDMIAQQPQDLVLYTPPVLQSRPIDPGDHQLTVGQEFPDVHSCRRALRDAAIGLRFEMQTIKSDKTRFTAKCAAEGCPWRIHAAKLPGVPTFTIRTIHGQHTCAGISHLGHQQASVQWVADSVEQRLRENPDYKPKEILEEIHRVHGIALSYKQAWRGKERIMAAVRGSFEEDYRLLPQYCAQIRRSNPGSIARVYGDPVDGCFQLLFVSFQASIFGFLNACRPLIALDRVSLKNKYLGTLLFATGFDGDGGLYPLAFGVVHEETDDNWMWFLSELHNLLETNAEYTPRLTFLSDRQKGIVDGVEVNFPTAFHGFCMRHLSESFRKEFHNALLCNTLWEAACSLTVTEFEAKILEMEQMSKDAATWIRRIPPRLWATAYFEGTRYGHLTADVVESLNTLVVESSGLPIIQMMECIRRKLMTWFNERREASMQWSSILVPYAEAHVSNAIERAHKYQVLRANEAEFEVLDQAGQLQFVVDIRTRSCSCRGWQLCGLPCPHAVAALLSCRQNVHRFTESFFTVANYRKTYSQTIYPVPDRTLWRLSEGSEHDVSIVVAAPINPPKSLRPPGRPRKRRSNAEDGVRVKRVVHCSRCNQTGHFRTTCTVPI